jgi:hypothetical protein
MRGGTSWMLSSRPSIFTGIQNLLQTSIHCSHAHLMGSRFALLSNQGSVCHPVQTVACISAKTVAALTMADRRAPTEPKLQSRIQAGRAGYHHPRPPLVLAHRTPHPGPPPILFPLLAMLSQTPLSFPTHYLMPSSFLQALHHHPVQTRTLAAMLCPPLPKALLVSPHP